MSEDCLDGGPGSWSLVHSPRRWQREAFDCWKSEMKGIAGVVTGAGKTVFAFLCLERFVDEYDDGRIIIVVPTISLLDQWVVALHDELNVPSDEIGVFSGEEKQESPSRVNVVVINTARQLSEWLASGSETFLVVDECHRAATPENSKALRGDHCATLGLSATPQRQYDDGFTEYLRPVLGRIIYEYNYEEAARDGIIAEFELVNVKVPLSAGEKEKYKKYTTTVGSLYSRLEEGEAVDDHYKRALRKRAEISALASSRIPVAVQLAERHRGTRMMLFHERIDAASEIESLLDKRGHSVTSYHSGISPDIRRSNLQLYRRGYFDTIVACRALDEGIDVPDAAVAIIAASTASRRQRVQRLGRVLRPGLKGSSACIYTLYATEVEERRLVEEAKALSGTAEVRWQKAAV